MILKKIRSLVNIACEAQRGDSLEKEKYVKEERKNSYNLPTPLSIVRCPKDDVAGVHTEDRFEFKFASSNVGRDDERFASMVYQYKVPINIDRLNSLSFDLLFKYNSFSQIDLEIKEKDAYGNLKQWTRELYRSEAWSHYMIDLTQRKVREKIDNIAEICFVVRPRYIVNKQCTWGEFCVKNFSLI